MNIYYITFEQVDNSLSFYIQDRTKGRIEDCGLKNCFPSKVGSDQIVSKAIKQLKFYCSGMFVLFIENPDKSMGGVTTQLIKELEEKYAFLTEEDCDSIEIDGIEFKSQNWLIYTSSIKFCDRKPIVKVRDQDQLIVKTFVYFKTKTKKHMSYTAYRVYCKHMDVEPMCKKHWIEEMKKYCTLQVNPNFKQGDEKGPK